ncbi:hypothetical protein F0562_010066 [Nyssa sinensis]|uniref:Uncharacterized protein n=1 Tax=Nyssa sinensis TaxID=561372 RepID=A0A5J4ZXT7_9ASTE|nr:hypothetical protein F0562_010066 [Nyssa sinensis]
MNLYKLKGVFLKVYKCEGQKQKNRKEELLVAILLLSSFISPNPSDKEYRSCEVATEIERENEERSAPSDAMDILCNTEWPIDACHDDQNTPAPSFSCALPRRFLHPQTPSLPPNLQGVINNSDPSSTSLLPLSTHSLYKSPISQ